MKFRLILIGVLILVLNVKSYANEGSDISYKVPLLPLEIVFDRDSISFHGTKTILTSSVKGEELSKHSEHTKWINPSNTTCISNGGKVNHNYCKANWEDAKTICSLSGGSLPSINVLRNVVIECGGTVDDYENDRNNSSYQSCYQKKGFASNRYWSSMTYANNSRSVWYVSFYYGFQYVNHKNNYSYVRCVSVGQ